ncbi:MAG: PQQ-binding-like beta-propeller repeat protein [Clostridia bacterium]|nr:PQQ-binding-like beta-propeller repeat protein [Clostridia bacterium]
MMKHKLLALLLTLCCLLSAGSAAAGAAESSARLPTDPAHTVLRWSLQLGKSYADAPSVPAYADGCIFLTSRTSLYKIDAATGEILQTAATAAKNGYATKPVCLADGKVFCPLEDGTVQAFDAATLAPLWTLSAEHGGQPVTEITYADGRIYTGFWNDIAEDADFICANAADGTLLWSVTRTGGYYGSGAVVENGCVYFGGDNGNADETAPGRFECRDAVTGKLLDSMEIAGNLRCKPALAAHTLYFPTKAGLLYKVELTRSGTFYQTQTLNLGGASTATPVLANGSLYLGVQTSGYRGVAAVIDAEALKLRYTVETPGYPACAALAVPGEDATAVYLTCNTPPGGIALFTDSANAASAACVTLFTPPEGARNYCLSTIAASEDGTLFYKNDSGYVFAVAAGDPEPEPEPDAPTLWQRIVAWFRGIFSALRRLFGGRSANG